MTRDPLLPEMGGEVGIVERSWMAGSQWAGMGKLSPLSQQVLWLTLESGMDCPSWIQFKSY